MKTQRAEIFVNAPIQSVFEYITDWRNTPRYERFVSKIEPVDKPGAGRGERWGEAQFTLLGLTFRSLYRYRSVYPHSYSGVQPAGLLRSGFWFKLSEEGGGTRVVHGEFLTSRWKLLERLAAFAVWGLLFPSDIRRQLDKLRSLLECGHHPAPRARAKRRPTRLAGNSLLD